jgi:hypothetical protein
VASLTTAEMERQKGCLPKKDVQEKENKMKLRAKG